MNYIRLINSFERFVETSYLSSNAQLLWYKLIGLFNHSGWREIINVSNRHIMVKTNINREGTLIKARDDLINAQLIIYKSGSKGRPGSYKINTKVLEFESSESYKMSSNTQIHEDETYTETETEEQNAIKVYTENGIKPKNEEDLEIKNVTNCEAKNDVQSVANCEDIYKQDKIKQNKIKPLISEREADEINLKCQNISYEQKEMSSDLSKVIDEFKNNIRYPTFNDRLILESLTKEYGVNIVLNAIYSSQGLGNSANYIKTVIINMKNVLGAIKPKNRLGCSYDPDHKPSYDIEAYERFSIFD